MTRNDPATLVRSPGGSQRATLLELFFDLVYVAALALTSMNLARHLNWAGAVQALLPLMALWWVWAITTLATDFYNPERLPIQALIGVVMFGSIIMAVTLPQAFGSQGMIFATTNVAIHLGRGIFLVALLRHNTLPGKRAARFLFWFTVSAVGWIVGAFMPSAVVRGIAWAAALVLDYVIAAFRYPTPWLGPVPRDQYDKAQEHIGERYQQFMILAFGDLILVAALRYTRAGLGAGHTTAFVATFATTMLLWQIYVYRAGSLLRNLPRGKPGRILRWAPYTHFIMIFGIVAAAAGSERAILAPTAPMPYHWAAAMFGGPALFMIGRSVFEYEVFDRISWSRLFWIGVLLGVSPAMVLVAPSTAAVIVAAILLGVAVTDAVRGRAHRPAQPGQHQHPVRRLGG
ncbi:low temperature requirement protein A [Rugosimonospora africana]|uniref:Membrane protein n=1 Tax=Rugosimonospora africana TaxID=556532 RepID=A0A8J3QTH2_9ACTN|nr:low temperature requirement protein A [Rugosimonospora africana]GIH16186.1 membrane protein [Rugosimonospora africana]